MTRAIFPVSSADHTIYTPGLLQHMPPWKAWLLSMYTQPPSYYRMYMRPDNRCLLHIYIKGMYIWQWPALPDGRVACRNINIVQCHVWVSWASESRLIMIYHFNMCLWSDWSGVALTHQDFPSIHLLSWIAGVHVYPYNPFRKKERSEWPSAITRLTAYRPCEKSSISFMTHSNWKMNFGKLYSVLELFFLCTCGIVNQSQESTVEWFKISFSVNTCGPVDKALDSRSTYKGLEFDSHC